MILGDFAASTANVDMFVLLYSGRSPVKNRYYKTQDTSLWNPSTGSRSVCRVGLKNLVKGVQKALFQFV